MGAVSPACFNSRLTCVAIATFPAFAQAADVGLDVRAGYINSDNVEQLPAAHGSSIFEAGGRVQLGVATAGLDLDLDSDLRFREYTNSLYGTDFLPRVRAGAVYTFSENKLYLTAQENLGQIALTSERGLQPADRQNVNVFTIGPDYFAEFTEATRLHLSGRYSKIEYSQAEQDGSRLRGEASLDHDLTNALTTSVGVFDTRVRFSSDTLPSNQTRGVTAGVTGETPRTQLRAVVGVQQLRNAGQSNIGPYGDLTLTHLISPRSQIAFSATSRFGDSTDAYIFGQAFTASFEDAVNLQVAPQPTRQYGVGGLYTYTGPRLTATLGGNWFREVGVEDDPTNRTLKDVFASAAYRFTGQLSLALDIVHDGQSSPQGLATDNYDDNSAGIELRWLATTKVQASLRGDYFNRTGSTEPFREWRYSIFVTWAIETRKEPASLFHRGSVNQRLRTQPVL